MQIVRTTDTCKIYGVNHTADNGIVWEQKIGTPYVLVCILEGAAPNEEEFRAILEREEANIRPDYTHTFNGGSIKLRTIEYDNRIYQINQTGVTAGAFAADLQNGELILYGYGPTDRFLDNNFCTIRTNVDILCNKYTSVTKSGGFLGIIGSKKIEKYYYEVCVNSRGIYYDGDVYYELNGYRYPIPASVIGKKFYLPVVGNTPIGFGKNASSAVNLSVPQLYRI